MYARMKYLIVFIVMFISVLPQSQIAMGQTNDTASTDLAVLSIFGVTKDGSAAGQDYVTRESFVTDLYKLLNYGALTAGKSRYFADIPDKSDLGPVTDALVDAKMIGNSPDKKFYPTYPITYEQALKMMVVALGYEFKAEAGGGYPIGYLKVADEISLTKKVKAQYGDYINNDQVMQLFYNFMNTPLVRQISFGDEFKYSVSKDQTIMSENWNITKKKGILTGNRYTSLEDDRFLANGYIEIDFNQYKNTDRNAASYLGYQVDYYLQSDKKNDETIMLVVPTVSNNVTVVNAKDIEAVRTNKNVFYYYSGTGADMKSEHVNISRAVDFIYNSKVYTSFTDADLIPENGLVTLIDNNNDSTADVVLVEDRKTIVVDEIAQSTNIVYNRYTKDGSTLKQLTMDQSDSSYKFEIRKGSKVINFSDLRVDDVLEVCISKNSGIKSIVVMVTNKTVSGKIESVAQDGGNTILTIDQMDYKVSGLLKKARLVGDSNFINWKIGMYADFLLNMDDQIVSISLSNVLSKNYAWLLKINQRNQLSDCFVKVILLNGKSKIYKTAEKVELNDVSKNKNQLSGLLQPNQLIIFKLNIDDEIISVKTVVDCPIDQHKSDVFSKTSVASSRYKNTNISFDSKAFVQYSKILLVPYDGDEEKYKMIPFNYFGSDVLYDIDFYDVFECMPEIVVYKQKSTDYDQGDYGLYYFLIDKITNTIYNEQTVQKVTGMYNGNYVTYYTESAYSFDGYKQGDVVIFETNRNNEIIGIRQKVLDANHIQFKDDGGFNSKTRIIVGRVSEVYAKNKRILVDTSVITGSPNIIAVDLNWTGTRFSIFDRKSKSVYKGSVSDFSKDTVVVVRMISERAYEVILYE